MNVGEAKAAIKGWIESGVLEEDSGVLRVREDILEREERKEDVFEEMLDYVVSSLGWDREEVMKAVDETSKRYGNINRKLALYLFGIEKGLNMEAFRERLNV